MVSPAVSGAKEIVDRSEGHALLGHDLSDS